MFSKRGEVSTIILLGTLAVVAVAAFLSSSTQRNKNTINTNAQANSCGAVAEPSTIQSGQSSTISWNFNGATKVFIGSTQFNGPSGTYIVNPTSTTSYRLLYTQPTGDGQEQYLFCDVTVTVGGSGGGGGLTATATPTRSPTSGSQQPTPTNPPQSIGDCRDNPVSPPSGGYTWVANCSKSCSSSVDCPQNTSDPGNVNAATSNWCYGFSVGARCLQLQKGNGGGTQGTTPTPTSGQSGGNQNGTVCANSIGCGGRCNPSINSGCGYYGCRFWEWCSPAGTCIDTTGGTSANPPGPDACLSKADSGGQNVLPTSNPTRVPTNPPSAQNTATPTVYRLNNNVGVPPLPSSNPFPNRNRSATPTPSIYNVYLPFVGTSNSTPTPIPPSSIINKYRIRTQTPIQTKACVGDPSTDYGCVDTYGFYDD